MAFKTVRRHAMRMLKTRSEVVECTWSSHFTALRSMPDVHNQATNGLGKQGEEGLGE